jgi:NAD(P)-dependent dehydrogenase (short-subunit alcohol dehydrogenase family)
MSHRLDGKVSIVTGAAQGIGAYYARGLAGEGAKVILADVKDCKKAEEAVRKEVEGAEYFSVHCDVSDENSVSALFDKAIGQFGRVDILVNNAAFFSGLGRQPFEEISVEEWDKVMGINLRGVFLCCRAATPIMRRQKYGKIVNIASDTMMKGTPNFAHYVSSKGGVVAFTRAISKEVGVDGICVNSVAPGLTTTDAMQAEPGYSEDRFARTVSSRAIPRIQEPNDLVGTVIFLSSPDSDFITGQCIVVNGGDNLY